MYLKSLKAIEMQPFYGGQVTLNVSFSALYYNNMKAILNIKDIDHI